jgi:hypothetical protein
MMGRDLIDCSTWALVKLVVKTTIAALTGPVIDCPVVAVMMCPVGLRQ